MRVAAGENSAESLQQFDAGTRANTGASATGPSLPVVNEWLAARSTHVRSSTKRSRMRTSHEPSPLLRLTLHWLLGVHRAPSPPPPLRVPVPALWPRGLDWTRRARHGAYADAHAEKDRAGHRRRTGLSPNWL